MRIKRKVTSLLSFAAIILLAILLMVLPKSIVSANAATNYSKAMITVGNVEKANGVFLFKGAPEEYYNVIMISENVTENGTLEDYVMLDWNHVTIKVEVNNINAFKQHRKFVLNKDGVNILTNSLSGTESMILFDGELEDGDYEFLFSTEYYIEQPIYTISYYRFHFSLDTSSPKYEIKGGDSHMTNGEITSKCLTYTATDPHFQRLYYKSPNADNYSTTTKTSYTVDPIASNSGWWCFYAIDSLGQKNETVRVYLDCKPPQTSLSNKMSFGTTVGDAITVTALDDISSAKLYVKFESEEWFSEGSSYTIPITERNGKYYFYAEDGNGNRSETTWIVLSTEDPTGSLVKSDTDNSMSFVWNNEYWSATLDGEKYIVGSLISNEGQHEIVLSNNAYKTKRYTFKIEHYYKVVEQTAATCSENGVATYECSQCGDRYEEIIYASGHKFNITSTPSSCTESEQIIYTCSLCGERYEKEGNYPTGHDYSSTITREPTCTVDGERLVKCDNCEESYKEVITANGHNYEISDTSTKNGKTTRTYKCVDCGDSYKQELGDQYEEVANYVEYLFEQYSPYMWWVLLASTGIWSIAIGVMIAIAQKNEEKEKAKKMLVNYIIGLVVIAVIVVACPFLIRGIATLI